MAGQKRSGAGHGAIGLKRLRLRSWRRGTREMDLILGRFADAALGGLGAGERAAYEALLSENDHDLYSWIGGSGSPPEALRAIVETIRAFHSPAGGVDHCNH